MDPSGSTPTYSKLPASPSSTFVAPVGVQERCILSFLIQRCASAFLQNRRMLCCGCTFLRSLDRFYSSNSGSIGSYNLPVVVSADGAAVLDWLVFEETCYDNVRLAAECRDMHERLNHEQLGVYNAIVQSVEERRPGALFVSGHGSTGKTFLWKTIISIRDLQEECSEVVVSKLSGLVGFNVSPGSQGHFANRRHERNYLSRACASDLSPTCTLCAKLRPKIFPCFSSSS